MITYFIKKKSSLKNKYSSLLRKKETFYKSNYSSLLRRKEKLQKIEKL